MYFLTVFLVLLVPEFIFSIQPPLVSETESWVPFRYQYTEQTQEFLKNTVNIDTSALNKDVDFIHLLTTGEKSKKELSSPPKCGIKEGNRKMCQGTVPDNNTRYVAFLNKLTWVLKDSLLEDQSVNYNIFLHTVNSFAGYDSQKDGNHRESQLNYRIMVNRNLETIVNIVSQSPYADEKIKHFVAFIIFLKFHPKSVPLYALWLVDKYKIHSENFLSEDSDCEYAVRDGRVDDKGSYLPDDEKLFDTLYKHGTNIPSNIENLSDGQKHKGAFIEIFNMFRTVFACSGLAAFLQGIFHPK